MSYPVPGPQPQPVTPQEAQQATAEQVTQVAADLGPGPQADPADLAAAVVQAGAQPGEVDAGALLRSIQAMQARLDVLEAEKRAEVAPEVVKYGEALAAQIVAKVDAHPHLANHPDNPLSAGRDLAVKVLDAAKSESDGNTGALDGPLAELEGWVKAHARQFPHIDWHYVLELAGEAAAAAARLAA